MKKMDIFETGASGAKVAVMAGLVNDWLEPRERVRRLVYSGLRQEVKRNRQTGLVEQMKSKE